ncbi:MAG: hypothetical protein ACK58J_05615, partial [Planctomyces sp.]
QEDHSRPRGRFPEPQTAPATDIAPSDVDSESRNQRAIDLWNSGQKLQAIAQLTDLLDRVQRNLHGKYKFNKTPYDLEDVVHDALLSVQECNTSPLHEKSKLEAY